MNILFMCVANSARSQMAEGLAKKIFASQASVQSAGSEPKTVNPYAIQALNEIGIDISKNFSKSFDQLPEDFKKNLNYIVTLCAEEVCPVVANKTAKRLHWPHLDPAGSGTPEEQIERFRSVRDQLAQAIEKFKEGNIV